MKNNLIVIALVFTSLLCHHTTWCTSTPLDRLGTVVSRTPSINTFTLIATTGGALSAGIAIGYFLHQHKTTTNYLADYSSAKIAEALKAYDQNGKFQEFTKDNPCAAWICLLKRIQHGLNNNYSLILSAMDLTSGNLILQMYITKEKSVESRLQHLKEILGNVSETLDITVCIANASQQGTAITLPIIDRKYYKKNQLQQEFDRTFSSDDQYQSPCPNEAFYTEYTKSIDPFVVRQYRASLVWSTIEMQRYRAQIALFSKLLSSGNRNAQQQHQNQSNQQQAKESERPKIQEFTQDMWKTIK